MVTSGGAIVVQSNDAQISTVSLTETGIFASSAGGAGGKGDLSLGDAKGGDGRYGGSGGVAKVNVSLGSAGIEATSFQAYGISA